MKSIQELEAIRQKTLANIQQRKEHNGTRIAAGARPVLAAFMDEVEKRSLQDVVVAQTGCIGVCRLEPIVEIYKPGQNKVTYVKVTPEMVARIVTEHVVNDRVVDEYTIGYYEANHK